MKDKLKSVYNWDGYSTVAAVAANLDNEGKVSNWELHIFGQSKGSKLDSSTFYTDQDEGNCVRFKEIEMSNIMYQIYVFILMASGNVTNPFYPQKS